MKRRLLSAFLAVMMVLTMAPVAFAADDDGVKSYDELVTAISEASDKGTIKLANDITLTDTLSINKNVTLDGQGHTISGTVPSGESFISVQIPNNGDFTMTNCVIVPSGKVTPNPAINLSVNGKVSVTNCTFGAEGDTAGYMYNGLEFSDTYAMDDTNITGNTFYGGAFRHNCISFYKMAENANINISNNDFVNLDWDTTNAIRVSNYSSANATITLNSNIYSTHGSDAGKDYAGLLFFQITNSHNDDLTKLNVVVNDLKTDFDGQLYYTYKDGVGLTSENEAVFHGDDSIAKYFVAKVGDTYYKTLAAAVAAAKDGGTIALLKDVEETLRLKQGEDITLNLNGHTLSAEQTTVGVVHGKLVVNGPGTIKENKPNFGAIIAYGSVSQNDTNYTEVTVNKDVTLEGWAPVFIDQKNGKAYGVSVNLNGVTLNAKNDTSNAVGSGVYVNGQITDAVNSPVINLDSTTIASTGHGMYLAGYATTTVNGGSVSGSETGIEIRAGKLTVNGATVTGNGIPTSVTPNGNGSTSVGAGIAVAQHTTELPIDVTISDGMISGYTGLLESNPQNNPAASIARVNINVAGGKFAAINGGKNAVSSDDKRVIISGGVFAQKFDNSYCATGLTVVSNESAETKTTYPWTVGTVEVKDENEIKTDTKAGATTATLGSEIATENENAAKTVGKSVTPTKLADTTPITPDDKAQALTELVKNNKVELDTNGKIPNDTTVTVVKETYLDVTVTAYDTTNNTVSMDITPKYNLIAVAKTGTDEKKVTLKSAQDAKVGSTEVQVTLPDAFKGKKVYINHNNGANLYVATADEDGKITFTTNGFSPFTFALSNPDVVAEVNGNAYKSLKEAIDAAQTGATIVLQKDCTEKVTVAGKSLTINRNGKTFDEANVTVGSNCTKEVKNDTIVVTYTKPSSGSSGGSSSGKTTYKVTTSAVNNGGVNASPSSAEKGATITITLSPDKGYKLDKLTVTDGSGKTVSTVKKSDTVYTFTMPASAVNVGVSYVKATETPSETKFNDVSANDWFASAVDYVTGKGMMNGTADNTFSPKANTTRGMVVTVLYRLENQPSTSAASFTDVASGAYYANAVAWANANGIVSGYGSGKFGPNDKVTREQLAAILYRYAQYKKYDVSVGEDTNILSYNDAQSISSYAIPAIQWACGAGVVTGKSGSKLDPKGNATRAEVAAMLMRFCENVK